MSRSARSFRRLACPEKTASLPARGSGRRSAPRPRGRRGIARREFRRGATVPRTSSTRARLVVDREHGNVTLRRQARFASTAFRSFFVALAAVEVDLDLVVLQARGPARWLLP